MKDWIRALVVVGVMSGAFVTQILVTGNIREALAQEKLGPAPEVQTVTPLEQAQLEGDLKDFQILRLKFENRIAGIRKAHGWGDDVMYDANQNKFFRLPKPAEAKPEPKPLKAAPEKK